MKNRTAMKSLSFLLGMALVLGLVAAALPQRARALEVGPESGLIGADEVINDDLVLNGNIVEMAGTVNGNVIAAGGEVIISGTVHGDVILSGGIIRITGTVDGNVIAASNTLELDGAVADSVFYGGYNAVVGPRAKIGSNLYMGAFNVELKSGSVISRDIAVGAYQLILGGEVKRDVHAGLGALKLTGTVGRNVTVEIGKPSDQAPQTYNMQFTGMTPKTYMVDVVSIKPGLDVPSSATIGGKFSYTSSVDQSAAIQAKPAGGVAYTYRAEPDDNANANNAFNPVAAILQQIFDIMREFLVLLVAGALVVWLAPGWLIRGRDMLSVKPGPSFLWGLLLCILVPIAVFFAGILIFVLGIALGIVTLGGLMVQVWGIGLGGLGLFSGIFGLFVTYGSKLVVSLLLGTWIIRLLNRGYVGGIVWPLLIGLVAYILLYSVPLFIGWILSIVVMIFGLGAIWLVFQDWYQNRRAQPSA
jgi:hypothetical protein